jgi:adenylate kinase
MPLWNRAIVVGLQGVGKTSLCNQASHILGYNYVNFGELMVEVSQKYELTTNLEEMLELDSDIQFNIWKESASKLIRTQNLLLDLHGIDITQEGHLISLPYEIIPPEIIIIIDAPYEKIVNRRLMDKSKFRRFQKIKDIQKDFFLLKSAMATISSFLGCELVIIENDDFKKCLEELKLVLHL